MPMLSEFFPPLPLTAWALCEPFGYGLPIGTKFEAAKGVRNE